MTGERHSFQGFVPERCAGQRFDRVAAELLAGFSRSRLTAWIRSGALTIDGRRERPAHRVLGGEPLALDVAVEAHGAHEPQQVPFEIVLRGRRPAGGGQAGRRGRPSRRRQSRRHAVERPDRAPPGAVGVAARGARPPARQGHQRPAGGGRHRDGTPGARPGDGTAGDRPCVPCGRRRRADRGAATSILPWDGIRRAARASARGRTGDPPRPGFALPRATGRTPPSMRRWAPGARTRCACT